TFDYEEYQHHLDLVRTFGPTALFMDRVIRKVSAPFKGLDVLDLGCGTGHLSRMLERDNRVVSYDPAFEGVRTTRERRQRPSTFPSATSSSTPSCSSTCSSTSPTTRAWRARRCASCVRGAGSSAWCRRTRRCTRVPTPPTATCDAITAMRS